MPRRRRNLVDLLQGGTERVVLHKQCGKETKEAGNQKVTNELLELQSCCCWSNASQPSANGHRKGGDPRPSECRQTAGPVK